MFTFNDLREKLASLHPRTHATSQWVASAAIVQIAQELNEIKHYLARLTGATEEDSIKWLKHQRDELWPDPNTPGHRACNELIQRYQDGR